LTLHTPELHQPQDAGGKQRPGPNLSSSSLDQHCVWEAAALGGPQPLSPGSAKPPRPRKQQRGRARRRDQARRDAALANLKPFFSVDDDELVEAIVADAARFNLSPQGSPPLAGSAAPLSCASLDVDSTCSGISTCDSADSPLHHASSSFFSSVASSSSGVRLCGLEARASCLSVGSLPELSCLSAAESGTASSVSSGGGDDDVHAEVVAASADLSLPPGVVECHMRVVERSSSSAAIDVLGVPSCSDLSAAACDAPGPAFPEPRKPDGGAPHGHMLSVSPEKARLIAQLQRRQREREMEAAAYEVDAGVLAGGAPSVPVERAGEGLVLVSGAAMIPHIAKVRAFLGCRFMLGSSSCLVELDTHVPA